MIFCPGQKSVRRGWTREEVSGKGGSLRPTEIGGGSPIGAFSSQRHTRGWSVGPGSRIGARSWASFVLIGG